MKIAIDARLYSLEKGGIARYTKELIEYLLKLKTQDTFHLIIRKEDERDVVIEDPRVHLHMARASHYSFKEQIEITKILKSIKPDVVHFTNFNQPLFHSFNAVTTIHDLILKVMPMNAYQKKWYRQVGLDLILRKALTSQAIIVPSASTKETILSYYKVDPGKVHVIYESASDHFCPQTEEKKIKFRQEACLEKPYILFVNQWRPHKGILDLVEVFEKLKREMHLPHELVLLGKKHPEFPHIIERIKQSPYRKDIILPGFIPDEILPLYYASADVVVSPSYMEGFGLGLVEAMKTGSALIAYDASGPKEITQDAAYLVKKGDKEALAQALMRVIKDVDYKQGLIERGLKRAKAFSWEQMTISTYALYHHIV